MSKVAVTTFVFVCGFVLEISIVFLLWHAICHGLRPMKDLWIITKFCSVLLGWNSSMNYNNMVSFYLQENQLTSLAGGGALQDLSMLQILDLHSNCFVYLPDEIKHLQNLRVCTGTNKNLVDCTSDIFIRILKFAVKDCCCGVPNFDTQKEV
jgi:hypothetical protein